MPKYRDFSRVETIFRIFSDRFVKTFGFLLSGWIKDFLVIFFVFGASHCRILYFDVYSTTFLIFIYNLYIIIFLYYRRIILLLFVMCFVCTVYANIGMLPWQHNIRSWRCCLISRTDFSRMFYGHVDPTTCSHAIR